MTVMSSDSVIAVRSEFSIEDPWRAPAGAFPVRLRRSTDGAPPRLATTVSAYYDDDCLTFVFSGSDDHVEATYFSHDDPLYEEDVVEVFLAPSHPAEYYEIEVNPNGAMFDAHILSPQGSRETMRADRSWQSGALAAVRKNVEADGTTTIDTLLRVPFGAFGDGARPDGPWRCNLFRIDRHPTQGDEYSAWRPTLRDPADFHVPSSFGVLEFRP
jgi:hypothetical protein